MILQDIPVKVETAADGRTALEHLKKEKCDALVLNVLLSILSGKEFLRELNPDSQFNNFPIHINSSQTGPRAIKDEFKVLNDLRIKLLHRPAHPDDTLNTMKDFLGMASRKPLKEFRS